MNKSKQIIYVLVVILLVGCSAVRETYKSDKLGITLQYPTSWQIKEEADDFVVLIPKTFGQTIHVLIPEGKRNVLDEQEALEVLAGYTTRWYDNTLWDEREQIEIVMEPTITVQGNQIIARSVAKSTLIVNGWVTYTDGTMPSQDFYSEIRVLIQQNHVAIIGIMYGSEPPPQSANDIDSILNSLEFID